MQENQANYTERMSLPGVGRWELATDKGDVRILFTPEAGKAVLWEGPASVGWRKWEETVEDVRLAMR